MSKPFGIDIDMQGNKILNIGALVDNTGLTDVTSDIEDILLTATSLYLPEGVYLVGDLELTGKKLYGEGVILKNPAAERALILNSNCTIEGLKFNSAVNGFQRAEIKLNDGAKDIVITNCRFESAALYAAISADANGVDDASLLYTNVASGIVISNNVFKGYVRPLYLHSVENINISNNVFRDCLRDAIRLRQRTGMCSITNNVFKNIGESSASVPERPANWVSLNTYSATDRVSVPPFGIYEANKATTVGENPATAGAADWDLVDGSYFETKDAIDTFWGGSELIISNNIMDTIASVGIDIKGSEPSGDYSTDSVIITGNLIKNTFGIGLNFHSAALLDNGEFRYVGNAIISNNIFRGCNAERYDVAQAAINLRQGSTNVTVANNHIKNHYGRGINVLNLEQDSKIQRSCLITGNQVIDCGLPGHAGNIGINFSPISGAIVKNNIVENTNFIPEYELTVTGSPIDGVLSIPSRLDRASINVSTFGLTSNGQVLNALKAQMDTIDFPDDPNPLLDIRYYQNVKVDEPVFASLTYQEIKVTSLIPGIDGNSTQFRLVHDNSVATGVFVGAVDVTGNVVTLTVRTSARANNAIAVFNNEKVAAGADGLIELSLADGAPSDTGSQVTTVQMPTALNLSGGVSSDKLTFFARIPNAFLLEDYSALGMTITMKKLEGYHNSVNRAGIIIRDQEQVGSTVFESGIGQMIIKDNILRKNASDPRFEILYNGIAISNPMAYVTSDNSSNTAAVAVLARTAFSGGANSGVSTHLNTLATLSVQGINMKARVAGTAGNDINLTIEQPTTANSPFRAIISPLTTVHGYVIGGNEIRVLLPTDSSGDPITTTVAELEKLLKTNLNQALLSVQDNILE